MYYQKQPKVQVSTMSPCGLLWVALIVLKLMEVVHWSWWIVIFWPLGILLGLFVVLGVGACIYTLWQQCKEADRLAAKKKATA